MKQIDHPSKLLTLPQELIDRIVDIFKGDTETLSRISLLARTKFTRSQFHLFRTLQVSDEGTTPLRFRFQAFLPFLCSASERFKSSIEVLHLRGEHWPTTSGHGIVPLGYLHRLKEELPRLSELQLECVDMGQPRFREISQSHPLDGPLSLRTPEIQMPSIQLEEPSLSPDSTRRQPMPNNVELEKLSLTNVYLYFESSPLETLVETLNVFPNLTSVKLQSLRFFSARQNPSSESTGPTSSSLVTDSKELVHRRLSSLMFGEEYYNSAIEVVPLIQAMPLSSTLRKLEFPGSYLSGLHVVVDLVSGNVGAQLTHLKITLFEDGYGHISGDDAETSVPLQLSTCSKLESLSLVIHLHRPPALNKPTDINYGLSAFETLSPSSNPFLRHLSLRFEKIRVHQTEAQRIGNESDFDWQRLDKAVSKLEPGLMKFEFGYTYNGEELRDLERSMVKTKLRNVKEMGVLAVL